MRARGSRSLSSEEEDRLLWFMTLMGLRDLSEGRRFIQRYGKWAPAEYAKTLPQESTR